MRDLPDPEGANALSAWAHLWRVFDAWMDGDLKTRAEMNVEAMRTVLADMLDYIAVQPEGDLPLLEDYVQRALDAAFGVDDE